MADIENDVPTLEMQRSETERLLAKPLVKNDTWYLVHGEWFKGFKRYIGFDNITEHEHPGPIDNSSLYKDGDPTDIREQLIEELDYVLVPEELWKLLIKWYGMVADQLPIPKKVVEYGRFVKNCKVEVYLLELQLSRDFNYEKLYIRKFSKADTINSVAETMKKLYDIPENVNIRLWGIFAANTHDVLHFEHTIEDEGLFSDQIVVVEVRQPDGTWLRQVKDSTISSGSNNMEINRHTTKANICSDHFPAETTLVPCKSSSAIMKTKASAAEGKSRSSDYISHLSYRNSGDAAMADRSNAGPSIAKSTRFHTSYGSTSTDLRSQSVTPGLCGLCNLGNTCFMNSVIQCMSNCPPVAKHFVDDEYLKDLNTINPLGMRGEIAMAFGELIKIMWSGKCPVTVPQQFKVNVGKFAPQFSGYQQHDSQELLTFLLDGLHEDLNRIKRKPYIELSDSDGRSDEELAAEAWDNYQKRNDSIIVDNFHGLLKSTVVCPDCEKVSVTFDPFCYLSLPLPIKRERHIEVTFFPFDSTKKPQAFAVMVPKRGQIHDLLCALSHCCGLSPDEMVVTEITKHHFHKFYSSNDPLESIDIKDDIAVYEIPQLEAHVPVPVVLWEVNIRQAFNFSQLFGHPMILMLPRDHCSYNDLYHAVLEKLTRYLFPPQENDVFLNRRPAHDDLSNASSSCASAHNDIGSLPQDLFTLHVVNASTSSVVHKLHNDTNLIKLPISDVIGRQYLAAQWTAQNRQQHFNSQALGIEAHDSIRPKRSHKVHLTDCLELYTVREKLGADDAWYCPSCKKHQRATKKFDLWNLPTILIIHLKRFSYSRYRRDKIDTLVEFPLRDLDMSNYIINANHPPAKYNLIGVCNHYGGMGGGHYTAFALNKIDKHWYSFDDHTVSPIAPESVITNSAYVLFYMRSD